MKMAQPLYLGATFSVNQDIQKGNTYIYDQSIDNVQILRYNNKVNI